MRTDADIAKYPALREDLKVSKQVLMEKVSYIIKDPVKGQYFRFDEEEWSVISLFDGTLTLEGIVQKFNQAHPDAEIDTDLVRDYKESLESMNLLQKSNIDLNIMLIEKMKEMRKSQLLSKKGSLFYKRFPLVDPDLFFNKVIPYLGFFWTRKFFIFSFSCMLLAVALVLGNWQQVQEAGHEVFSFSKLSFWNFLLLWITIYVTIAIHELGHGLTCKYYGGEVHEMGFLLLFFQPCLYCNVNDAWLFDKKWKQVIVTVAGGYIELFVGAICAMIWFVTNPNTFVNILAFQVMTVCSISTVLFNFNPLIKLDGYYLLADYLEVTNLKDSSFNYLKYLVSRYVFRSNVEDFEATKRERRIFFAYGVLSFFWQVGLLTGLITMAKGILVEHFYDMGILLTIPVAVFFLKGQVKKGLEFLLKWAVEKRELVFSAWFKKRVAAVAIAVLMVFLIPIRYTVPGQCTLEPSFIRVLRAGSESVMREFIRHDGEVVAPGELIARMDNPVLDYERTIAALAADRLKYEIQQVLLDDPSRIPGLNRELEAKRLELRQKAEKAAALNVTYPPTESSQGVLACADEIKKVNSFFKEGDEVCKVLGIGELKTVIQVSEQEVRFIKKDDPVSFRLKSEPWTEYNGKVSKIRVLSTSDPLNPKAKLYEVEMVIRNSGILRPGMSGSAKIIAERVPIIHYIGRKLALFFRFDLFL